MSGLRKGSLALAGCLFIFMMVAVAPTVTAAPAGTLWSKIDPNKEYVVVNCINTIEYWNAHKYAWKHAGELFGVKTSWVGSDNDDTAVMVSNLESVISKKPAASLSWAGTRGSPRPSTRQWRRGSPSVRSQVTLSPATGTRGSGRTSTTSGTSAARSGPRASAARARWPSLPIRERVCSTGARKASRTRSKISRYPGRGHRQHED